MSKAIDPKQLKRWPRKNQAISRMPTRQRRPALTTPSAIRAIRRGAVAANKFAVSGRYPAARMYIGAAPCLDASAPAWCRGGSGRR